MMITMVTLDDDWGFGNHGDVDGRRDGCQVADVTITTQQARNAATADGDREIDGSINGARHKRIGVTSSDDM